MHNLAKEEGNVYNGTMTKQVKRVYVETSVIGGMFDKNDHPAKAQPFWDAVFAGKIRVVLSNVLEDEIKQAPQHVRDVFANIPESQIERIVATEESNTLAAVYVAARIVSPKHLNDSKHVAFASVARVDVLVSWNCRHIVNRNRIDIYNDINEALGYTRIEIQTPDKVN
jgi:predicted nucleic acid-binding protein